jgi:CheY-like chemotaxis protein
MKKKILVIDDDIDVIEAIAIVLDDIYALSTFVNPLEAIEKLKTEKFDLIITDLVMPDINGIEVIAKIRENDTETPVVVFSRLLASESVDTEILNISKYIEKPLEPEVFTREISLAMEGS